MGLLANLIPVARAKAQEILLADAPSDRFGGRDVKGLTYVPLEQLALRCGTPRAEALENLAYDEGCAVFLVHPKLTEAAQSWSDADIEELADWWQGLGEHAGMPREWLVGYLGTCATSPRTRDGEASTSSTGWRRDGPKRSSPSPPP